MNEPSAFLGNLISSVSRSLLKSVLFSMLRLERRVFLVFVARRIHPADLLHDDALIRREVEVAQDGRILLLVRPHVADAAQARPGQIGDPPRQIVGVDKADL